MVENKNNNFISVVVPVYGCYGSLEELYFKLVSTLVKLTNNYEIILVDDRSPDNAWDLINELCGKDKNVKGIRLSRNFGQHYAITAGLDYSKGEWVVVMDCDLQDNPQEITKLYNKANEGYDIVFARRAQRKDGFFKRISSKIFYKIFDFFTENTSDHTIANFGIYNRKVIDNFLLLREKNRFFQTFIRWVGFNSISIDVNHSTRTIGKSSYTFTKLVNLAIDIIVSHSNKPLRVSIKFGFLLSILSFIYIAYLVVRYYYFDVPIGWTSLMASIFFIGGLLFANLGLIGLYIGKIFDETKNRPLYIIDEIIDKS